MINLPLLSILFIAVTFPINAHSETLCGRKKVKFKRGLIDFSSNFIVSASSCPQGFAPIFNTSTIKGEKGDTGAKGDKGDTGAKGNTGNFDITLCRSLMDTPRLAERVTGAAAGTVICGTGEFLLTHGYSAYYADGSVALNFVRLEQLLYNTNNIPYSVIVATQSEAGIQNSDYNEYTLYVTGVCCPITSSGNQ